MKIKARILVCVAALLNFCTIAAAQEKIGGGLEIDKMIHNFGEVMLDDGPVTCEFTITNKGDKPAVIYNVTTTCGCTDVEWTREPLKPGAKGKVSVTYSNDEGPYPFDKSITVYHSESKKPLILKLRGVSLEKMKPLTELYPVSYGPFALKETISKCGNLEQGGSKSEGVMVANTSSSPVTVSFRDVDENLNIKVSPNPIPANSTAEMTFTITADKDLWGKNTYWATPVVNGKTYVSNEGKDKVGVWAFTKDNFSDFPESERQNAPRPKFETSTFSFGKIRRLGCLEDRPDNLGKYDTGGENQRNRSAGDECEFPVDRKQDDKNAGEGHDIGNHVGNHMCIQELEVAGIVDDTAHQVTGLFVVEEAEVKAL